MATSGFVWLAVERGFASTSEPTVMLSRQVHGAPSNLVYVDRIGIRPCRAERRSEDDTPRYPRKGSAHRCRRSQGERVLAGNVQRFGLAAAVVSGPDLLLLDEPAAALDSQGRREVLDLVVELRGESTIISWSHILDDAQEVCDEIAILARGSIVYNGTLDSLVRHVARGYTYRIETRGDKAKAVEALQSCDWITQFDVEDNVVLVAADDLTVLEVTK